MPDIDDRRWAMNSAISLYGGVPEDSEALAELGAAITDLANVIHNWISQPSGIDDLVRRINELEARMSRSDEKYEQLRVAFDGASNRYAASLQALRDEIVRLDSSMSDRLDPIIEGLNNLGADPSNPVPDVTVSDPGSPVE